MPLYDYYCEKCGKYFEILVSIDRSSRPIFCKYCREELKKLPSAP